MPELESLGNILYLEPVGGIAGDMLTGCFLDLGLPIEVLRENLAKLPVGLLEISASSQTRHSLTGIQFKVRAPAVPLSATNQQTPLIHQHSHQTFASLRFMLEQSGLSPQIKATAINIFHKLAVAEGKIHGVPPETVHFHEVGAWDSIADIVSIAVGVEYFNIEKIYVGSIPLGSGTVMSQHGELPVPAPATLELLRGFSVIWDQLPFERTTPTGAAVLSALAEPRPAALEFVVLRTGIGTGTKDFSEVPNILRATLGTPAKSSDQPTVECAEVNLDDCSGEWLGWVQEQLLRNGALDVWFVPVYMKKNRPGTMLQVLYPQEIRDQIHQIIRSETTTIGLRYQKYYRKVWPRQMIQVATSWGMVQGKVSGDGISQSFKPEYEDCRRIAEEHSIPLKTVFQEVMNRYQQSLTITATPPMKYQEPET
ncbi:MAG: nickel pincer cofactor biosynthesis protein LarC [SAR324 cluster bacterium]|nr:nickel pincer cofactor biosynthesis protein LarC [SAR324 cluster bacterium]